ncbi:MAG: lipopolysaccharide biosynthesis protein, partial [Flavobacteriaceae bacterium]|nr:lipopolysaccharide biosynthesis protein [Flavobacteriaceae bacterium]
LVKYYSTYKTRNNVNSFLTLIIFLPLLLTIPIGLIGYFAFDIIADFLSQKNIIIRDYVWLIYITAIAFAYFEVFYSWTKVQMKTVFGNFMKEVFHRAAVMLLLFALYLEWLTIYQFINAVVGVYVLRMFIMKLYAYYIRRPILRFNNIPKLKEVLKYSALIIIAGSVGGIILEIDKFMIGEMLTINNVAYYGVAIYIASVIGVPSRSMHQITNPITAKFLNENNIEELGELYKKSSLNLFIVSGFIFLLIVLNINQLYALIKPEYSIALYVVFFVSIAKLSDSILGNNNAILFNSKYYKIVLLFGVLLAALIVVLNLFLIPKYGINGAAFATFISVMIYNILKLGFVYTKYKIIPFTSNTLKALLLIVIMSGIFYFWELTFHPILNIVIKSIIITAIYVFVIYKMSFSEEITTLINKFLKPK